MSIPATIAGIPFLATAPDYNTEPSWKRNWIGDIAASLVGQEQRAAMRSRGLVTLGYSLAPANAEERAQIEAVWRAALKAARIAVPCWTHGADLASDVAAAASALPLSSSLYTFRVGDFLWLRNGEGDGQVNRVAAVNEDGSVSLTSPMAFALSALDVVWPIVFGIPKSGDDNDVDSPARLLLAVTVTDIDEQMLLTNFYLKAPVITEPMVGGMASSYGARISWRMVQDAAQYLIEVFSGAVCGGTAIWSQTVDFRKPVLAEPAASGTLTSYGARVSWTPVSGCAGYKVEVFTGAVCGGGAIWSTEVSA